MGLFAICSALMPDCSGIDGMEAAFKLYAFLSVGAISLFSCGEDTFPNIAPDISGCDRPLVNFKGGCPDNTDESVASSERKCLARSILERSPVLFTTGGLERDAGAKNVVDMLRSE